METILISENHPEITNQKKVKLRFDADHGILHNATHYLFEGCIAGTSIVIDKTCPEGKYIGTLIQVNGDKRELYNYVNDYILRHIELEKFERLLLTYTGEAYDRGQEDKATEIRKALNI